MMKRPACPLCSSDAHVTFAMTNNQFGFPMDVMFCSDCEWYFVHNKPDSKYLEEFYENDYFADSRESTIKYLLKSKFAALRASSQNHYFQKFSNNTGSVLEVGSADGTFLSFLKKAGWKVSGLEFNKYMVQKAKNRFDIDLQSRDILTLSPESPGYNSIVMLHVIEHMSDPVSVLRHIRMLLDDQGLLFLEVPHSPFPEEVDPEILEFYLSTTHLTNYRPRSLQLLVEQAGFHVVNIERFFYPVPNLFHTSSRDIGRILMNGSLHTIHPYQVIALGMTIGRMTMNNLFSSDPFKHVELDSPWQGVGDSLRIIATIAK